MTQKPSLNPETEFVSALKSSGMKARGWDIFIPYAHAYLESGNFQNELAKNANNPFSVKAFRDWNGAIYTMEKSPEWEGNKIVYISVDYRKYQDMGDCLHDYEFKLLSLYPRAYDNRGNSRKFYYGLMNYGTDDKGNRIAVYPSYCPNVTYPDDVLRTYDKLKKQNYGELFQSVTGG